MKLVIEDEKPKDIVKLQLKQTTNGVKLVTKYKDEEYLLITFHNSGDTTTCMAVPKELGFQLTKKGELVID